MAFPGSERKHTMNRPLNELEIANPCPKSWGELTGDGTRRYCDACELHVTNLSAMRRSAAQEFLDRAMGRTCVTYVPDETGAPRFAPEPAVAPGIRRGWIRAGWLRAAGFLFGLVPLLAGCRESKLQQVMGSVLPPGHGAGDPDPGEGDDPALIDQLADWYEKNALPPSSAATSAASRTPPATVRRASPASATSSRTRSRSTPPSRPSRSTKVTRKPPTRSRSSTIRSSSRCPVA